MIITPIHTNLTTNIPKSNMISNNKTAVFKPTFQGDVNYMESLINSESISNLVDKNRFKEAYILINRLKDNFYPNYIDRRTKIPLLLKLARKQKNYFIRKSDKNLNYINEIMIQIINHKDFNPNIPITLVDKRGNKYKSTYIEEAINKENTHFATIIEGYMEGINDPYNDSFNTLISNA